MRITAAAVLAAGLVAAAPASAGHAQHADREPSLRIVLPEAGRQPGAPIVALTFDACSGKTDSRILDTLVENAIPATLFVTHRWLNRNPEALAVLLAHPDLFEIENHGDHHVPMVTDRPEVFGLKSAGTMEAVKGELQGGAAAVAAATGAAPHWFRGATARYSEDALAEIRSEGYEVAGYSLNADVGASLSAKTVTSRLIKARSGDVVIAHINQPDRSSGAGVAAGILALQKAGVIFVRLSDVTTKSED